MVKSWYTFEVVCHWCGKHYKGKKSRLQARFCSARCKQAHYRAYKHYVTATNWLIKTPGAVSITLKKRKKRK